MAGGVFVVTTQDDKKGNGSISSQAHFSESLRSTATLSSDDR